MKLPKIPIKLENWDIEIINEVIKYVDIESETLDFKKEPNKLFKHICAMANTSGGFLVLGINQIKSDDGKTILRFEKTGFHNGQEDAIRNEIGNGVFCIEPTPTVEIKNISDNEKFYSVIKIENEISKKPFFIKDKGQSFVRIESSTRPASRTTLLAMFSSSIEQRKNVENLRTASEFVKEAFQHALADLHSASWESVGKIPPIDLTFLRNAVSSCEWLLRENNLLGRHTSQSGYEIGIYSILHDLEFLNVHIDGYNIASDNKNRQALKSYLAGRGLGSRYEEDTIKFLEMIITKSNEFLQKNQK